MSIDTRNPHLTLGASDPVVPDLCRLLTALGYDPGPLGGNDVSPDVLRAVRQFRDDAGVTEDRADLPDGTEPNSAIGTATWAALHDAAAKLAEPEPEPEPAAERKAAKATPVDPEAPVAELRAKAAEVGVIGFAKLNRAELVQAIEQRIAAA